MEQIPKPSRVEETPQQAAFVWEVILYLQALKIKPEIFSEGLARVLNTAQQHPQEITAIGIFCQPKKTPILEMHPLFNFPEIGQEITPRGASLRGKLTEAFFGTTPTFGRPKFKPHFHFLGNNQHSSIEDLIKFFEHRELQQKGISLGVLGILSSEKDTTDELIHRLEWLRRDQDYKMMLEILRQRYQDGVNPKQAEHQIIHRMEEILVGKRMYQEINIAAESHKRRHLKIVQSISIELSGQSNYVVVNQSETFLTEEFINSVDEMRDQDQAAPGWQFTKLTPIQYVLRTKQALKDAKQQSIKNASLKQELLKNPPVETSIDFYGPRLKLGDLPNSIFKDHAKHFPEDGC